MLKKYPQFCFGFAIVFFAEIFAICSGNDYLRFFTKPLICIVLFLFIKINIKKHSKFANRILMGLVFSWLGDVFLMLTSFTQFAFILGLSSFLIAHLFYISAFYLDTRHQAEFETKNNAIPIFLVFGFFCMAYYIYLRPYLGAMQIPVLVYCFTISLMAIMASLRYAKTNTKSFYWVLLGAVLFLASDSVLAYNKFVEKLEIGNLLVMITYMAAQFLITVGTVERKYVKKN